MELRQVCRIALLAGLCIAIGLYGCVPAGVEQAPAGLPASAEEEAVRPGDGLAEPSDRGPRARILVTTGFGADTLLDVVTPIGEDTTAMQALQAVADVGTAYAGGFVQSINGIGGTRAGRADWFYSVNGVLANRGAADLVLRDGDVEHWDYRQWAFRRNVSATLGCFPFFFLNGYGGRVRPTVVAYEERFAAEAERIVEGLQSYGVVGVEWAAVGRLPDEWRKDRNLIIVAGAGATLVSDLYGRWDRLGLFTQLEEGTLRGYTASGEEVVMAGESVGVLEAMQNPWNPSGIGACENVVLLLSGTDEDGVRAAAAALVEQGDAMIAWCGAVVRDGVAAPVPLAE